MAKHSKLQHHMMTLRHWWQTYFLLRWVVACVLGWVGGLIVLALMLMFFGWIGALVVGAGIGAGLSAPQAWILFSADELSLRRKWIVYSSAGTFFAVFPAIVLMLIGLFNLWLAAILIGLVAGGIIGLLQSFVLKPLIGDDAFRWIPVSIVAAIIAALLLVITFYLPLPIIASPATIAYGLITGWQLQKWHDA